MEAKPQEHFLPGGMILACKIGGGRDYTDTLRHIEAPLQGKKRRNPINLPDPCLGKYSKRATSCVKLLKVAPPSPPSLERGQSTHNDVRETQYIVPGSPLSLIKLL